MDRYLKDDEQENLKGMLYSYLRDKAARREGITSKNAYEGAEENFVNQMRLKDAGAMVGAMSSAASMAGTLGGKRSEASIVPKMNDQLYESTQGAYENFRTLRDQEERSNMNDLNVARYVSDLERADDAADLATRDRDFREKQWNDQEPSRELNRQLLQKRLDAQSRAKGRVSDRVMYEDGRPVVVDEYGEPTVMPKGFKFRQSTASGKTYPLVPDVTGPNGEMYERTPEGLKAVPLPPGAKRTAKPGRPEQLDPIARPQASTIGNRVANQAVIVNTISSAKKEFDKALAAGDEDRAITIGRGIIKTLNSDQGPDAVGAEEAKRLAGYLEYQILNLTEPGKVHGRDLEGFGVQMGDTINKLKGAISAGQKQLEQLRTGGKIEFDDEEPSATTDLSRYPRTKGNKVLVVTPDGKPGYVSPEFVDGVKYKAVK